MNLNDLKKKYEKKLEGDISLKEPIKTKSYEQFREESIPKTVNFYEKLCNYLQKFISFTPNKKARIKLTESISTAHLNVTPEGIYTLSYIIPIFLLFFSIFIFALLPLIFGSGISLFYLMIGMVGSLIMIIPLQKYPVYLATSWRLKSSNQMVLSIFYMVTYMRHSSNLERAIEFAGDHLDPPLSLDFKKILWDVETEKYDSITDSLDMYLKTWKKYNDEFVDSIHLIQSSLLEGSNDRRLDLLDKSLDVVLDGTYEKMLHYAQNLKNPITALHMLGVIMPILGLVILPLAVSFLDGITWIQLAILYNVILPFIVYFMGKNILASRPSGYGDADITKNNKKEIGKISFLGIKIKTSPLIISLSILIIFLLIGTLPLYLPKMGAKDVCWDFSNPGLFCEDLKEESCYRTYCVYDYRTEVTPTGNIKETGPFGFVASLLSIFIPLGLGLSLGVYYKLKSKNIIKIRNQTKKLEKEFSTSLFQLGNRLGDGLPAEIAIPRVAEIMEGTISGNFFSQVSVSMQKLGKSLEDSIFGKNGAIVYFPSKIIRSSMKVLVESIKKGPLVAAQALNNVARYIKEIHRVDERLKDLLSDIISSMKQQINFLAPTISGVVIGITSMITFILGKLSSQTAKFANTQGTEAIAGALDLGSGIPTYFFQLVVGVYIVQIIYILTILANSIENGDDKLGERYNLGKNLIRSTLLYCGIAFLLLLVFQLMAGEIISRI